TGVGARASSPDTHVPTQRAHSGSRPAPTPKRSLVRSAIGLLLQKPSLAAVLEPPYGFAALRQPGVELLVEIVEVVQQRPEISTGALLEHFAEHEQSGALQKLASQTLPGGDDTLQREFLDAVGQLEKQTVLQRLDELQAQQREVGLDEAGKRELLMLLQTRLGTPRAPA
ncbi:MAG: DNA primase, partial [Lysobacter sp.]